LIFIESFNEPVGLRDRLQPPAFAIWKSDPEPGREEKRGAETSLVQLGHSTLILGSLFLDLIELELVTTVFQIPTTLPCFSHEQIFGLETMKANNDRVWLRVRIPFRHKATRGSVQLWGG